MTSNNFLHDAMKSWLKRNSRTDQNKSNQLIQTPTNMEVGKNSDEK